MFRFFKHRKKRKFHVVDKSKLPKEKFIEFKKSYIEVDPVKILKNIFSKKVILPIIAIFILCKGFMIFLYGDFYSKGEEVILNINSIRNLCIQNEKFDKENKNDFSEQQKLVDSSIQNFVHSWSYPLASLFLDENHLDDNDNLYRSMRKQSHEDCSELLKNDPQTLQEQLDKIASNLHKK